MTSGLRIIFMGTPDFAVSALKSIHESEHEIIAVYSQPPRPKGRGYEVQPSPVQAFAEKNNIPVFHPKSLKSAEEQKKFADLEADIAIVAAYGLLLPKAVLDAPKHGCINIHASILPRWRGASPIQQSIWKGDSEAGVTLMQMNEGLDTGPAIVSRSLEIKDHTTAQSLHDDLSVMGAGMIVQLMDRLASEGKLESKAQDDSKATYAPLLKKEDGKINFEQSAVEIHRQIRALNPWPGTFAVHNGKRIKILEASVSEISSEKTAGTILDKEGHVQTGHKSVLKILKLQPENAKAMDFTSALNGGYIKAGDLFS
jgi:methionyl-tRNA formyltransferase